MGGMKFFVLLALIVATVSATDYTKGCTQRCPLCLAPTTYTEYVKDDVCSYCYCDAEANQLIVECPPRQEYDPVSQDCVPSTRCGGDVDNNCNPDDQKYCKPCYDEFDLIFPSSNPCGYCKCTDDHNLVYVDCPEGTGLVGDKCVPKDECGKCDECSQWECPPCYHGMNVKFPNPYNDCSFCCCESVNGSVHETANKKNCPDHYVYNSDEQECVWADNPVCNKRDPCPTTPATRPTIPTIPTCPPPPKPCDVVCPPNHYGEDWLMPNPIDKCSFCCCKPDGSGQEIPHLRSCMRSDQWFDPSDKRCKTSPNGECPAPEIPRPEHCRNPGDRDGCNLVIAQCKYDQDGHIANPWDDASFCQCDFDRIHWMPCAGGTTRYDEDAGACV